MMRHPESQRFIKMPAVHAPRVCLDNRTKYMLVVVIAALIVAVESIAVEASLNIWNIGLFAVSSIPSIFGGLAILSVAPRPVMTVVRSLDGRAWATILAMGFLFALGALLWFDAVGRIGASKEALLGGGSSEVLFVVLLSALFLKEKLSRWELFGGFLIIGGVALVLANTEEMSFGIGLGEMEAITSSFLLGVSIILLTKMLRVYPILPISAIELILSGIMLLVMGIAAGLIAFPSPTDWLILLVLSSFPALSFLTYNAGLRRVGASITSVLFALTGILTVLIQATLVFLLPEADFILPEHVLLATAGGVVAFVGIYILHMNPGSRSAADQLVEPGPSVK